MPSDFPRLVGERSSNEVRGFRNVQVMPALPLGSLSRRLPASYAASLSLNRSAGARLLCTVRRTSAKCRLCNGGTSRPS